MGKRIAALVVVLGTMSITATSGFFMLIGIRVALNVPVDYASARLIAIGSAAVVTAWTLAGKMAKEM